jgi:hypothetical protein
MVVVMTGIYIATEDALSEAVADRLVAEANQGLCVAVRLGRRGNSYLRKKLPELVRTAKAIPVLLLTGLDRVDCPPTLLANWRDEQIMPSGMLFRVAVREIEAWLLADREGFAEFCWAPLDKLPERPELLADPKKTLLALIRRYGKREIKAGILPERGSTAKIGFMYNQILAGFVSDSWSVVRAARNADSLGRTCRRLDELGKRCNEQESLQKEIP